jgi:hypothetical protein
LVAIFEGGMRQNCLFSVAPERLSPAAAVRTELKEAVRRRVQSGAWQGVDLLY